MGYFCYNKIRIEGNKQAMTRLVKTIKIEVDQVEWFYGDIDFNTIIPSPVRKITKDQGGVEFAYNSGRPDWCEKHWGTKINAISSVIKFDGDTVEINFETDTTPSLPVTAAMAKLFPELNFKHFYEEPIQNFKGFQVFIGGELVENFKGNFY